MQRKELLGRNICINFIVVVAIIFSGCGSPKKTPPSLNLEKAFTEKIQCVGSSSKGNYAVYLHGFTGESLEGQERQNLTQLKKLGRYMNMMVAIPHSPRGCYKNGRLRRCWGVEMTEHQASQALQLATKAARKCFPPGADFGIIGFSNGGYIATKVFGHCLAPRLEPDLKWIVTVGAAKLWGEGLTRSRLSSCRPITLVSGKKDTYNYERRQRKFRNLRRKGAKISILLFDGGHELPFGPMITALRGYLK